jgi:trans-2,3-dihydro-3-hydroxyanthranilate isomerase
LRVFVSKSAEKKFTVYYIDAFTERPFQGNPCAVVLDAAHISSRDKQRLALEFGLSETAFVESVDGTRIKVRFYTPAQELPFAGHPCLATVHALFASGAFPEATRKVTLLLPAGDYTVHIKKQNGKNYYSLQQPPPLYMKTYESSLIKEAFSLGVEDVLENLPIQTVSTGTPQLMVPLVDQRAVHNAALDIPKLARLRSEGDFYSVHLFCVEDRGDVEQITYARHFCLPPDRTEDPFTGSATGAMAAYLWRFGLLKGTCFSAYQGEPLNRPGEAQVEIQFNAQGEVGGILVSGMAVTSLSGELSFGS